MTIGPVNSESPYLPATQELSEELPQLQKELLTLYKRIATNVNTREIGRYDCVDQSTPVTPPGFERPTGQTWFGSDNQNQRTTFRKVVLFSGLTAGTNTSPHNLGDIAGYTFTYIGGCLQQHNILWHLHRNSRCHQCFDCGTCRSSWRLRSYRFGIY